MNNITIADTFLPSSGSQVFVRQWQPAEQTGLSPIVLLHDSLGSVELWRDFPLRLAAKTGRRVIAYDRVGFGRSDAHAGVLKPDFVRDEGRTTLDDVCRALEVGDMILMGHSVGGGMALSAGATHADRTVGIITLSAQAFVEDRTLDGIREAQANFQDEAQVARLAKYHGDKARWVLDAWIETWLAPSFADWSLDADLAGLQCPVLTIHGENDEFGSKAHPDRISSLAASPVQVVMIENGGHMPHKEQPERVLELVADFIDTNRLV